MAGYILTGDRSKFLETDGSIAWLYSCAAKKSPFQQQTLCYDHIPVYYQEKTQFVDPVTRRIVDIEFVNEIPCDSADEYVFQFIPGKDDSWYSLVPFLHNTNGLKKFSPRTINRYTPFHTYTSGRAGIYIKKDIWAFFTRMSMGQTEKGILKKISKQMAQDFYRQKGSQTTNWRDHVTTKVYLDGLISPNYWTNQFKSTFGTIAFYLEKMAIIFSLFLLIKFLSEVVCTIMRAFEIQKLSGRTVHFGKIIAASMFNVMILSVMTDLFTENDENKKLTENDENATNKNDNNHNNNDNNHSHRKHRHEGTDSHKYGTKNKKPSDDKDDHEQEHIRSHEYQKHEHKDKSHRTYDKKHVLPPELPKRESNYNRSMSTYENPRYSSGSVYGAGIHNQYLQLNRISTPVTPVRIYPALTNTDGVTTIVTNFISAPPTNPQIHEENENTMINIETLPDDAPKLKEDE